MVKMNHEKKETIKFLTEKERCELFKRIDQSNDFYKLRNHAIFSLANYCALRASEIGLLTMNDFLLEQRTIHCHRIKGGTSNTLRIIDNDVMQILENYMVFRNIYDIESKFLFPSRKGSPISRKRLDALMKFYCQGLSITDDKHHFHVLRHTRAIQLAEAGLDIKDIQFWLGHKNIDNTMIYLQFTTKQHDMMYQKLVKGDSYVNRK